jgi:hypothetical protein
MIEQFCFVWQYPGGGLTTRSLEEDEAVETLWQLWSHALYWRVPSGVDVADLADDTPTTTHNDVIAMSSRRADGQRPPDTKRHKKGNMR